ncbi:MAG: glycosyltransferase family 39 protein [Deltaproteobacteria bacterium]|nr:glycosyltransferase family 39 protein [Deltaproteobacteria bacterium]
MNHDGRVPAQKNRLVIIILALSLLRLLYIGLTPLDLSPDEAHYWEWSRHLDWSYYSKGPAVAYVIAMTTAVFGQTAFGVRAGAVFFSALASYLIYLFGKDIFDDEKTGFYAALLSMAIPFFSIGGILITTDVLFIFFWTAAFFCIKRGLDTEKQLWWCLAGAATGFGFLSKYTMVFIYPALFFFLLASRGDKRWLKRKEPYIAFAISLVFMIPVIYWNLTHGEVTIRHTMGQAHLGEGGFSLTSPLEFLGSQFLLITPLLFIGLVYAAWKAGVDGFKGKNSGLLFVFFSSVPLFLFFLAKSVHGKVQANWAVAAYVPLLPAVVFLFLRLFKESGRSARRRLRAVAGLAIGLGVGASFVAYFPWTVEMLTGRDAMKGAPFNRVTDWRELGEKVSDVRDAMGRAFVMSDTYQITSELAFYTRGNPSAYNVDTGQRRMNQYDLWPGFDGLTGQNAVYVKGGDASIEPMVAEAFDSCGRELFTIYRGGRADKDFSIFSCYNFKGMKGQASGHGRF